MALPSDFNYLFTEPNLVNSSSTISVFYRKMYGIASVQSLVELYDFDWGDDSDPESTKLTILVDNLNLIVEIQEYRSIFLDKLIPIFQSSNIESDNKNEYIKNLLKIENRTEQQDKRLTRYLLSIYYDALDLKLIDSSFIKGFIPSNIRNDELFKQVSILYDYIIHKYDLIDYDALKTVTPQLLLDIHKFKDNINEAGLWHWQNFLMSHSATTNLSNILLNTLGGESYIYESVDGYNLNDSYMTDSNGRFILDRQNNKINYPNRLSADGTDVKIARYDLKTGAKLEINYHQEVRGGRSSAFDIETPLAITDKEELKLTIDIMKTFKPFEVLGTSIRNPESARQMILSGGKQYRTSKSILSGIPGAKVNGVYVDFRRVYSDVTEHPQHKRVEHDQRTRFKSTTGLADRKDKNLVSREFIYGFKYTDVTPSKFGKHRNTQHQKYLELFRQFSTLMSEKQTTINDIEDESFESLSQLDEINNFWYEKIDKSLIKSGWFETKFVDVLKVKPHERNLYSWKEYHAFMMSSYKNVNGDMTHWIKEHKWTSEIILPDILKYPELMPFAEPKKSIGSLWDQKADDVELDSDIYWSDLIDDPKVLRDNTIQGAYFNRIGMFIPTWKDLADGTWVEEIVSSKIDSVFDIPVVSISKKADDIWNKSFDDFADELLGTKLYWSNHKRYIDIIYPIKEN